MNCYKGDLLPSPTLRLTSKGKANIVYLRVFKGTSPLKGTNLVLDQNLYLNRLSCFNQSDLFILKQDRKAAPQAVVFSEHRLKSLLEQLLVKFPYQKNQIWSFT